ncbi:hypothetical protein H310_07090 [Aphanomyces invadans]|uniref:Metalloendopeptidase n=1 Tax=Aphanomyces invadans TaxID=157072 RepID=A0A024U4F2_9STRA|nr:hypothetical protein H310_07090 [Aphanomyces invadans]ETW00473.1 hypothetical protein H310_07090 [Aphanomyces invadans]|eukprot:XP_008870608.1 hypothetical protein H310_07090 [Aphanomyces invadans]
MVTTLACMLVALQTLFLAAGASPAHRHVVHVRVNDRTMACSLEGCLLVCNIDQIMLNVCAAFHIDAQSCVFEGCDLVCNDGATRHDLCKKTHLKGARQLSVSTRQLGASIFVDDAPPLWPKGQICYKIDGAVNVSAVKSALAHWEASTPLRFFSCQDDRHDSCCAPCGDYLHFQNGSGCFSSVGYIPGLCGSGGQPLVLASSCGVGNIIHEIGHAVGLVHEHQRADRDSFVKIYPGNIDPLYLPDFDKGKLGGLTVFGAIDDGTGNDVAYAYDYDSVMHYGLHDFSINNLQTLLPITPTGRIREDCFYRVGQRKGLSVGDIQMVQGLYQGEIDTA